MQSRKPWAREAANSRAQKWHTTKTSLHHEDRDCIDTEDSETKKDIAREQQCLVCGLLADGPRDEFAQTDKWQLYKLATDSGTRTQKSNFVDETTVSTSFHASFQNCFCQVRLIQYLITYQQPCCWAALLRFIRAFIKIWSHYQYNRLYKHLWKNTKEQRLKKTILLFL